MVEVVDSLGTRTLSENAVKIVALDGSDDRVDFFLVKSTLALRSDDIVTDIVAILATVCISGIRHGYEQTYLDNQLEVSCTDNNCNDNHIIFDPVALGGQPLAQARSRQGRHHVCFAP